MHTKSQLLQHMFGFSKNYFSIEKYELFEYTYVFACELLQLADKFHQVKVATQSYQVTVVEQGNIFISEAS